MRESILSVLPGEHELRRVVVVHCQPDVGRSQVLLRQESWSPDIGWFTQSSLELTPEQVPGLRMALGSVAALPRMRRYVSPASAPAEHESPRIVRMGA